MDRKTRAGHHDRGNEFAFKALEEWAWQPGIKRDFIRPGRPNESVQIEALNGPLRDEWLSVLRFNSLDDARRKIEVFRQNCNHTRPGSSLRNLISHECAQQGQQKWISEDGRSPLGLSENGANVASITPD